MRSIGFTRILHLARTDLRRWRWPLAGWVLLVVLRLWIDEAGPMMARAGAATAAAEVLSGLLPVTQIAFFCLLVSLIVHETPLVGTDAFWLTRPIDRRQLLAAKLLTLGCALVLLPQLGDVLLMLRRELPGSAVALAAIEGLLWRFLWLLIVLVVASVTPSPVRFGLALAAIVLALAAALTAFVIALTHIDLGMPGGPPAVPVPDSTGALALLVATTAVAAAVVWHQFVTRRRGRSIALALVGLAAVPFVAGTGIWPRLRAREPEPPSWAMDRARTPLELATPTALIRDAPRWRPDDDPKWVLAADVTLPGVPADHFAEVLALESRVVLPDGLRIEGSGAGTVSILRSAVEPRLNRYDAWQRVVGMALGRTAAADAEASHYEAWPVLATISPDEAERLQAQRAGYSGSFEIRFWRYRAAAILALGPAVFRNGVQVIEILNVERGRDSRTVLVRRSSATAMLRPEVQPEYAVVLRHRERGEVLSGESRVASSGAFALLQPLGFSIGQVSDSTGFHTYAMRLRFPGWDNVTGVDAAWFDQAEIVIVETVYAGGVSRQFTVEGLTIERDTGAGLGTAGSRK